MRSGECRAIFSIYLFTLHVLIAVIQFFECGAKCITIGLRLTEKEMQRKTNCARRIHKKNLQPTLANKC